MTIEWTPEARAVCDTLADEHEERAHRYDRYHRQSLKIGDNSEWDLRQAEEEVAAKSIRAALAEIDRLTARNEALEGARLSEEERRYLSKALGRMIELRDCAVDEENALSIGNSALADEIDWLDCFINQHSRSEPPPQPQQPASEDPSILDEAAAQDHAEQKCWHGVSLTENCYQCDRDGPDPFRERSEQRIREEGAWWIDQQSASEGKEPAILQPTPVSGEALIAAGFVPLEQITPTPSDFGAVSDVDALVEEARRVANGLHDRGHARDTIQRLATAPERSRLTEADVEGIARLCALHGLGRLDGAERRLPPNDKWTQEEWDRRILECVPTKTVAQCHALARAVIAHINASRESGDAAS